MKRITRERPKIDRIACIIRTLFCIVVLWNCDLTALRVS